MEEVSLITLISPTAKTADIDINTKRKKVTLIFLVHSFHPHNLIYIPLKKKNNLDYIMIIIQFNMDK